MGNNQIHEDISYIKNMIENNRRVLVDNGLMFINNGIYIVAAVVISYVMDAFGKEDLTPYLLLFLMALLIAANAYVGKKNASKHKQKTFAYKMFTATWLSCGIPMGVIGILFLTTNLIPYPIFFFILSMLFGIGYFLTGTISDLIFMKYLAAGWWAGAIAALFWQYFAQEYNLSLFFAFLLFAFEVIPGIIIYKKWNRVYND